MEAVVHTPVLCPRQVVLLEACQASLCAPQSGLLFVLPATVVFPQMRVESVTDFAELTFLNSFINLLVKTFLSMHAFISLLISSVLSLLLKEFLYVHFF